MAAKNPDSTQSHTLHRVVDRLSFSLHFFRTTAIKPRTSVAAIIYLFIYLFIHYSCLPGCLFVGLLLFYGCVRRFKSVEQPRHG